jgi:hypothetical protein
VSRDSRPFSTYLCGRTTVVVYALIEMDFCDLIRIRFQVQGYINGLFNFFADKYNETHKNTFLLTFSSWHTGSFKGHFCVEHSLLENISTKCIQNRIYDPDPVKNSPDPQHWLKPRIENLATAFLWYFNKLPNIKICLNCIHMGKNMCNFAALDIFMRFFKTLFQSTL